MMPSRDLEKDALGADEDWIGNGAAFKCPVCGKIYIVSAFLNRKGRACPSCGRSRGSVSKWSARIVW